MVRPLRLLALAGALLAGCCELEGDPAQCLEPPPPPCEDRVCGERCFECSEGVPPWACQGPDLHCTRDRLCVSGSILCE